MKFTWRQFFNGFLIVLFILVGSQESNGQGEPLDDSAPKTPSDFNPTVTATCGGGKMTIIVASNSPFYGTIHPRVSRSKPCVVDGVGKTVTKVTYNMVASPNDYDYCGIYIDKKSEERSVQVSVRAHRTLELAEDKHYVVTCGKAGFRNDKYNATVRLGFYSGSRHVTEVFQGRAYKLRVDVSNAPEDTRIWVRSCFSFGSNSSVPLVDDNGCPEQGVISRWSYSNSNQAAEATIFSMFRFQDSKKLNFQCEVLICQVDQCPNPECNSDPAPLIAIPQRQRDTTESSVLAATTVFVLDPGDKPGLERYSEEDEVCTGICPKWLLWLAIALAVLFVLMLLVNLFLCSALTCTCTRTELVEKEPSVLEDYDPYRSWAGSQYGGSRYSLNGKPMYSESNGGSDHYATVPSRLSPSRPGSRYSNSNGNRHTSRPPPSPYFPSGKL